MKEKDLDKNLDNIIIDGLIREAEQESADFAAAMRKMSDEEFEDIIHQPAYVSSKNTIMAACRDVDLVCKKSMVFNYGQIWEDWGVDTSIRQKFKFKNLIPWIAAAVSAAVVVLIVLIPSFNAMNAKLCDSALYMSEAYITTTKGYFDVSSATIDQIKYKLPLLKRIYDSSIIDDGKFTTYTADFQDAGWTLAVAYLKLHKKHEAVKVLQTLEKQTKGTPFGAHCKKILEQLD